MDADDRMEYVLDVRLSELNKLNVHNLKFMIDLRVKCWNLIANKILYNRNKNNTTYIHTHLRKYTSEQQHYRGRNIAGEGDREEYLKSSPMELVKTRTKILD